MKNQIVVPNVYAPHPDNFFDGIEYLSKEIGDLKLLRKECRDQIVYYDNKTSVVKRKMSLAERNESDLAKLESLCRRIQFNPADDFKIPEIAKNLSMSESKLTRLFRSIYGTSIHRYIQDKRLEKAAGLIAGKAMNVSQAAMQSGYSNMSWFSKEFKEKFGIAPKKFSAMKNQNTENC